MSTRTWATFVGAAFGSSSDASSGTKIMDVCKSRDLVGPDNIMLLEMRTFLIDRLAWLETRIDASSMSIWTGSIGSESCALLEIRKICRLSKNLTSLAKGSKSCTILLGSRVKRPSGLEIASRRGKDEFLRWLNCCVHSLRACLLTIEPERLSSPGLFC